MFLCHVFVLRFDFIFIILYSVDFQVKFVAGFLVKRVSAVLASNSTRTAGFYKAGKL